jgi:hypothetical protein
LQAPPQPLPQAPLLHAELLPHPQGDEQLDVVLQPVSTPRRKLPAKT